MVPQSGAAERLHQPERSGGRYDSIHARIAPFFEGSLMLLPSTSPPFSHYAASPNSSSRIARDTASRLTGTSIVSSTASGRRPAARVTAAACMQIRNFV